MDLLAVRMEKRRSDLEVLNELSLVVWFFLQISEQRAALTSDSMFFLERRDAWRGGGRDEVSSFDE